MNIQNKYAHRNSFWDWTPLNECFRGTNIRVTDIDGFVERNGRFLVIETKKPGDEIPQGQGLTFAALAATGLFTIVIIWGKHNAPEEIGVITRDVKKNRHYKQASMMLLQKIVTEWFAFADNQQPAMSLPRADYRVEFFEWDNTAVLSQALGHEGECQACGTRLAKGDYFRIADGRVMHLSCVRDWETRARSAPGRAVAHDSMLTA